MIASTIPIANPKINKQRKIRIQIVRDANVTPANGAKCAQVIMDAITKKILPHVPVQFEYGGLPEYIDAKTMSDKKYNDCGVIVVCIVQNLGDFTVDKDDDLGSGLSIPMSLVGVKNMDAIPDKEKAKLFGALHTLILLGQRHILGDTGDKLILHEFGHAFGLRHEMANPTSGLVDDKKEPLADPDAKVGPFDPKSMMNYAYPPSLFKSGKYPAGYSLSNFENKNSKYSKDDVEAINTIFKPLNSKPGPLKFITKFDPDTIDDFTYEPIAVPCRKSVGVSDLLCEKIADKSKWIQYKNVTENGKTQCGFLYYNYPKLCKEFPKKPPAVEMK